MRKLIIVVMFSFLSTLAFSQNARKTIDENFRKYEIGINATHFLSNIFSLSNNSESIRYAVTSRYFTTETLAFRLSLGGDYNQTSQDFGSTSSDQKYNGRLGLEFGKPITNKFYFYTGVDFFAQTEFSKSTTNLGFDQIEVSTKLNNIGLGPALRLEYHITDRIVLMTEGFFYASSYNRVRNENSGQVNRKVEKGIRVFLSEPTNLFIAIKF